MNRVTLWVRGNLLRPEIAFLLLLFIAYTFFCPRFMYMPDAYWWAEWTKQVLNDLGNAYKGSTEYPPGFQYFLYSFGQFEGSTEFIDRYLYQIKYFTLVFDFAGAYLVYRLLRKQVSGLGVLFFLLFNVAYLYNTLIWGQVDAVFSAFVFAAALAGVKQRVHLSVFLYIIALSLKAQAIVFLPPLGILWVTGMQRNFKLIDYPTLAALMVVTTGVILVPFRHDMDALMHAMTTSVDRYPVISMEAYNLWHLLALKTYPLYTADSTLFAGLTYKTWGLLMFCTASGIVLLPLAWRILQNFTGKAQYTVQAHTFMLAGALVSLSFFFFNTQMHERYSHPAFLFLAAYAFMRQRYLPYVLFSAAYFLNLEALLHYMDLPNYHTLIFDTRFIAGLYLTTIVLLFWDVITLWRKQNWQLNTAINHNALSTEV